MPEYTNENIRALPPNGVFVFGSNFAGRHGRGAAKTALHKFGARSGQGTGLAGQSYGIATKDKNLNILSLVQIGTQVAKFLRFAEAHPEKTFHVTQIGCGLSKYSPKDIAPLFFAYPIPKNVLLPESFWKAKP